MSTPHHPDAPTLWLRIVAADPRYAEHLTVGVCSGWLRSRNRLSASIFSIDRDGDIHALTPLQFIYHRSNWDAQVVVDGDTVHPCVVNIAKYLDTRRSQSGRE